MRYPKVHVVLWVVQGLLALFFAVASGAPKLLLPLEMIPMPIPLPDVFVRSIGVAEVLGALGLILPGLTHIRPRLTPLAAACLALLTVCAAVYQLAAGQPANAFFAIVVGMFAAFVAYGRVRLVPLPGHTVQDGANARRSPQVRENLERRISTVHDAGRI